jgi:hypothetical protein
VTVLPSVEPSSGPSCLSPVACPGSEKKCRFRARKRHRGCYNQLIERKLNDVRAPPSRDLALRIPDYCLAAMLVFGMSGAAASQNQVQGARGQNNGQPVHIEAMTLEIRDKDKIATFSGNVRVVQGDTTMRC